MMKKGLFVFLLGLSLATQAATLTPAQPLTAHPYTKLGWMYLRGTGTKRNVKKAYRYFEKGAATGDETAQLMQASLLGRGRGVKQDLPRARQMLLDLVHNANPHAAFQLAMWCAHGLPCPEGPAQQQRWLAYAAQNEVPPAVLRQGLDILEAQPQQGFALIKHAAEDLHFRWAYYQLARAYAFGHGTDKDEKKAFDTMLEAAKLNVRVAQFKLAQWYEDGFGTTPDITQAFYWMHQAAQNGYAPAQEQLSYMYQAGLGTTANKRLAKQWAKQAKTTRRKPAPKLEEIYSWK